MRYSAFLLWIKNYINKNYFSLLKITFSHTPLTLKKKTKKYIFYVYFTAFAEPSKKLIIYHFKIASFSILKILEIGFSLSVWKCCKFPILYVSVSIYTYVCYPFKYLHIYVYKLYQQDLISVVEIFWINIL